MLFSILILAVSPPQQDAIGVVARMEACRGKSDDKERLACYDAVVEPLAEAQRAGRLIVLDRNEVIKERRRQFGLVNDEVRATGVANVTELTATVRELAPAPTYGRTHIALDNGQVWESVGPMRRRPKVGESVKLRMGQLGAFRIEFDGGGGQIKRVR